MINSEQIHHEKQSKKNSFKQKNVCIEIQTLMLTGNNKKEEELPHVIMR